MALQVGSGAVFWAYISPQNDTEKAVTTWSVTISQGAWSGTITSEKPHQQQQTRGMSGIFNVVVTGSGPNLPEQKLTPQAGSKPDIGCNSNCAAMVGIVASADGKSANYWTTWDVFCEGIKPPH